mgnify:FL=1
MTPPSDWVDRYGDFLYSFALYRIPDEVTAQDLVQETLASALKAKDGFKGKSSEKTWLTGILKHKIIDHLRKKYREPVVDDTAFLITHSDAKFDSSGKWVTGPAHWKANPEKLLEQKSFLDIVRTCLESLPERPAHVLSQREIEGVSTKKICKDLDITPTNCWVILHRARALMRDCIEHRWMETKNEK